MDGLAEKMDCTFVGITADDLKRRISTLYHARCDALSLFGG